MDAITGPLLLYYCARSLLAAFDHGHGLVHGGVESASGRLYAHHTVPLENLGHDRKH